jgi:N-omega-hydroxy-L-arginine synthase
MIYVQKLIQNNRLKNQTNSHWRNVIAKEILNKIGECSGFPCPFSQSAAKNGRLLFTFIDDNDSNSLHQSANDLREYLKRAARWDGKVSTAEPLLMAFNPEKFSADCVEAYHEMGWKVLQFWHDNDPEPWPMDVSVDPHSPFWSMCFAGIQIFVNMSNPAHKLRLSRNLGDAMIFVINPRKRFDQVAGDNPQGHKIREIVRQRIEAYDAISPSPVLGHYEAGDIEWLQYGLTESNAPRKDQCPFHSRIADGNVALRVEPGHSVSNQQNPIMPSGKRYGP